MYFIASATVKDLRRQLRDPLGLGLWLAMPLLVGGLLTLLISGSEQAPPRPHLLIADEDGAYVGDLLTRAFAAGRAKTYLQVEEATSSDGRERMGRGEASALLIVPPGFRRAVLRDEATKLLLVTNPAQRILPKIIEETLEMVVESVFYLHRLAGPEVQKLLADLPDRAEQFNEEDFSRIGKSINQTVERAQKYLSPPVIELESSVDQAAAAEPANPAKLFLPGILFMALLFMASNLSGDVWRERDLGTLRRAACTPASTGALLGGKLAAAAILLFGGSVVVLAAGMFYFKVPLAKLPLAAVWSTLAGLTFFLMFFTIQLFATNQRAATVLTNCIVFPLMFMGGSFFPFDAMPDWMATIGRKTPNGWSLERLDDILFDSPAVASVASAMAVLLIVSAILFLLGERRLRRFARR
jgi:ABC-type multidrug transport system permease subunit